MKVKAKIDLPAEITKDSVVKQLLDDKKKLEGKVGRLEQKIIRLELSLNENESAMNMAGEYMQKLETLANEYLRNIHDGCE